MNFSMIQMSSVALAASPAILFNNPIPIISNTDPVIGMDRVSLLSTSLLASFPQSQTLNADRFGSAESYLAKFRMAN